MITSYYTLKALVREWQDLVGSLVGDAYSHHRGELTLAFYRDDAPDEWSLKVGTSGSMLYVFRYNSHNRPRRNVSTLFEQAFDRRVASVTIAERDRFIRIALNDRSSFVIMPFGPRANVFLVNGADAIAEAFRNDDELRGTTAPEPSPAPDPASSREMFASAIEAAGGSIGKRVRRALPLFDQVMATEVCSAAGIDPSASAADVDLDRLLDVVSEFQHRLENPQPRIYRRGKRLEQYALVPMQHLEAEFDAEPLESVDLSVRVFVRGALAQQAFDREYEPLRKALEREVASARKSVDRMVEELSRESRADRYEAWGHLLMAHAPSVPEGVTEVEVADLFHEGEQVTIPLDPERSAVQNAERFYSKARRTRQAREHAESRLDEAMERQEALEQLHEQIRQINNLKDLHAFQERHESLLKPIMQSQSSAEGARPYRSFERDGYEILVGRSASLNDRLTFGIARKFDLWLHARGVPGSHVVLRRNRDEQPPKPVLQHAAGLAAWFSKARGSALVPVIVTERKYVRRARGGAPGAVIVEREDVLMAEPLQPDGSSS